MCLLNSSFGAYLYFHFLYAIWLHWDLVISSLFTPPSLLTELLDILYMALVLGGCCTKGLGSFPELLQNCFPWDPTCLLSGKAEVFCAKTRGLHCPFCLPYPLRISNPVIFIVTAAKAATHNHIHKQFFLLCEYQIQLYVTPGWPIQFLYKEIILHILQKSVLLTSHLVALPAGVRLKPLRRTKTSVIQRLPRIVRKRFHPLSHLDCVVCYKVWPQCHLYWPVFWSWPTSSQPTCHLPHRRVPYIQAFSSCLGQNSLILFPLFIPEELLSIPPITVVMQAVPPHLSCSNDVAVLHVVL